MSEDQEIDCPVDDPAQAIDEIRDGGVFSCGECPDGPYKRCLDCEIRYASYVALAAHVAEVSGERDAADHAANLYALDMAAIVREMENLGYPYDPEDPSPQNIILRLAEMYSQHENLKRQIPPIKRNAETLKAAERLMVMARGNTHRMSDAHHVIDAIRRGFEAAKAVEDDRDKLVSQIEERERTICELIEEQAR